MRPKSKFRYVNHNLWAVMERARKSDVRFGSCGRLHSVAMLPEQLKGSIRVTSMPPPKSASKRIQAQLRGGKGIRKVARECGVGTGTVQRVQQEMKGPFVGAAA